MTDGVGFGVGLGDGGLQVPEPGLAVALVESGEDAEEPGLDRGLMGSPRSRGAASIGSRRPAARARKAGSSSREVTRSNVGGEPSP